MRRCEFFGVLVALVSVFSCVLVRADSYDDLLPVIRQIKTEKISLLSGDQVMQVLEGLQTYSPDDGRDLKERLFIGMTAKRAEQLAALVDPGDGALFLLMYFTREGVPDNLTDDNLHQVVGRGGQALVARVVHSFYAERPITPAMYNSLENFSPDVAASYLNALCNPWFVIGDKPYGAPNWQETWASDSYFNVVSSIRMVEFARQSVVVRLLDYEGIISVPTSVNAEFSWSGAPDVTIYLSSPTLTADDILELYTLVDDPNWGYMAQNAIEELE